MDAKSDRIKKENQISKLLAAVKELTFQNNNLIDMNEGLMNDKIELSAQVKILQSIIENSIHNKN